MALGGALIIGGIVCFFYAIDLYLDYRFKRDFNGCIFLTNNAYPFYEITLPLFLIFNGVVLVKKENKSLKFLAFYMGLTIIVYLLSLFFNWVYCLFNNCIAVHEKMIDFFVISILTFFVLNVYNFNWNYEINQLKLKKSVVYILIALVVNFVLIAL